MSKNMYYTFLVIILISPLGTVPVISVYSIQADISNESTEAKLISSTDGFDIHQNQSIGFQLTAFNTTSQELINISPRNPTFEFELFYTTSETTAISHSLNMDVTEYNSSTFMVNATSFLNWKPRSYLLLIAFESNLFNYNLNLTLNISGIDSQPPVITVKNLENGGIYGPSYGVDLMVVDDLNILEVQFLNNGTITGSFDFVNVDNLQGENYNYNNTHFILENMPLGVSLESDGVDNREFTVRAMDYSYEWVEVKYSITVISIGPSVTITGPLANSEYYEMPVLQIYEGESVTIFLSTDGLTPVDYFVVTIDGNFYQETEFEFTIKDLAPRDHPYSVSIYAVDIYGNPGSSDLIDILVLPEESPMPSDNRITIIIAFIFLILIIYFSIRVYLSRKPSENLKHMNINGL
jgi:hypothetical protein